jgi:hypothetical protein
LLKMKNLLMTICKKTSQQEQEGYGEDYLTGL